MKREKRHLEIAGIFFILFSILLLLSITSYSKNDFLLYIQNRETGNIIGPFGVFISHFLRQTMGISSYIISFLFMNIGWMIIHNEPWKEICERTGSYLILTITSASLISLFYNGEIHNSGGFAGISIINLLESGFGHIGTIFFLIILSIASFIFIGIFSFSDLKTEENRSLFTMIFENIKKKISPNKEKTDYPKNSISESIEEKKKKLPWITKKRIIIYETEKMGENIQDSIRFLEMSNAEKEYYKAELLDDTELVEETENPIAIPELFSTDSAIADENPTTELPDNSNAIPEDTDEEDIISIESNRIKSIDMEIEQVNREEIINFKKEKDDTPDDTFIKEQNYFEEITINDEYIIPISFLSSTKPIDSESWKNEVQKNSMLLVNTLGEFGIESKVVKVNRGPVLTLYEMQIAPGIKVNRIVGLSDDIAMALAASRVRIVAPIPGKSAIGVEVPNKERELVTLGDIIKSPEYQNHHGNLKVGLGKDILGKPIMLDIKKLPHLLIAGATGAGKSVCVNSIITSLIYNYDPNYVRFILIDPKMVELQLYDGMPHLLTPVITDPTNAPMALRWIMNEMERRYRLLSEVNTRDILRYNEKIDEEKLELERLPFIVAIIDELADLMMVASKEIEGYITRIAQKARAVGIHLVLATQRPSVDIITGIIKANIPARIAFQVAQKTDSRTIIDQNGAEKLLGKGDMLYQSPMSSFPTRIQGALIAEEEIMHVVKHLEKFGAPSYIDIEENIFEEEMGKDMENGGDELFVEALKIIEETKKASASYLQRRLSIGYNRAARIIEQMEDMGYVGPQQGSKPREVFI